MQKKIFLFVGQKSESYTHFSDRMITLAKDYATEPFVSECKVTYTATPPPSIAVIPFKKKKVACISAYFANAGSIETLTSAPGFVGAYEAEEAIPVGYAKSWNDLMPTPGICLLTLFKKKPGLHYEAFIDRWHNSHTPLSLKIHPLWNYNRNVVKAISKEYPDPWDGIVEEQFKTTSDLLNPIKFFGHPLIMPYRMWQVYFDTRNFLDYRSIEPYFAMELWIKSKSG